MSTSSNKAGLHYINSIWSDTAYNCW